MMLSSEREREIREAVAGWDKLYPSEAREILAALDELRKRNEQVEAYAKEGWDWLSEALDALGVSTVFEIADAKKELTELRVLHKKAARSNERSSSEREAVSPHKEKKASAR